VVGEFSLGGVLALKPHALWAATSSASGIDKLYFDEYFQDRHTGFALKVGRTRRYSKPLDLEADFGIKRPPQSFCYLN
jgi:predicted transcriptional regulator